MGQGQFQTGPTAITSWAALDENFKTDLINQLKINSELKGIKGDQGILGNDGRDGTDGKKGERGLEGKIGSMWKDYTTDEKQNLANYLRNNNSFRDSLTNDSGLRTFVRDNVKDDASFRNNVGAVLAENIPFRNNFGSILAANSDFTNSVGTLLLTDTFVSSLAANNTLANNVVAYNTMEKNINISLGDNVKRLLEQNTSFRGSVVNDILSINRIEPESLPPKTLFCPNNLTSCNLPPGKRGISWTSTDGVQIGVINNRGNYNHVIWHSPTSKLTRFFNETGIDIMLVRPDFVDFSKPLLARQGVDLTNAGSDDVKIEREGDAFVFKINGMKVYTIDQNGGRSVSS
jgi:hypothetical protein